MTDPRLDVSFEGIGAEHASYEVDNSTITYDATQDGGSDQVGLAVNLSAGKTVQLVGDGEVVLGKLVKVEPDGIANVQTGGYVTLPGGEGATLTPGKKIVGDLAVGKGVVVINSAGNERGQFDHIIAPADGDSVIAVGAVDASETYTYFSSPGPTWPSATCSAPTSSTSALSSAPPRAGW